MSLQREDGGTATGNSQHAHCREKIAILAIQLLNR